MNAVFSAMCGRPDTSVAIDAHIGSPDLVTSVESGTLWLWAYPELIGWPFPIQKPKRRGGGSNGPFDCRQGTTAR